MLTLVSTFVYTQLCTSTVKTHDCSILEPGLPDSIRIRGSTSRSVSLSWSPPTENQRNGIIIGYVIIVTQIIPATTNQPIRLETTELELEVPSLHPGWGYEFSVSAETSAGMGPARTIPATLPEDGEIDTTCCHCVYPEVHYLLCGF